MFEGPKGQCIWSGVINKKRGADEVGRMAGACRLWQRSLQSRPGPTVLIKSLGCSRAVLGSHLEGFIKRLSYITVYMEVLLWLLCGGCIMCMSLCVRVFKNKGQPRQFKQKRNVLKSPKDAYRCCGRARELDLEAVQPDHSPVTSVAIPVGTLLDLSGCRSHSLYLGAGTRTYENIPGFVL